MTKYTSKLQDKRVLVLGGTSGIGFCVAEAALEYGAIVVVSSSRQAKIDTTIKRLLQNTPNGKVTGMACDLSDSASTEKNLKALLDFATKDGKLDHIVNTAGDALIIPKLSEVTIEQVHAAQQVRLMGSLMIAKLSTEYMNISNASSITFTGGVNTWKPGAGWGLAATAGAAIEGLARGMAVDLKPVRVNVVSPGAIMTELWTATFKTKEAREQIEKAYESKLLTGEIGRPEDTAEAYLYFMRDKFIDGQVLLTEGGYLLM